MGFTSLGLSKWSPLKFMKSEDVVNTNSQSSLVSFLVCAVRTSFIFCILKTLS